MPIQKCHIAQAMRKVRDQPIPPLSYPKTLSDLEKLCRTGSTAEGELANPADPGQRDPAYLKRKADVIAISAQYNLHH